MTRPNDGEPDEQAIRSRCEAAQEGPWTWDVDREVIVGPAGTAVVTGQDDDGMECGLSLHRQNSEFLTHARQDVPALLELVDELRADRDRYERRFTTYGNKLREWQECTGFANPSSCQAEIDRLRGIVDKQRNTTDRLIEGLRAVNKVLIYEVAERNAGRLTSFKTLLVQMQRLLEAATAAGGDK